MGRRAEQALDLTYDDLYAYLRSNHSVFMQVGENMYYLTDVNDHDWRVQDTSQLNEKGHFVDCSELVYILNDFLSLPFADGESVKTLFDKATFYASLER